MKLLHILQLLITIISLSLTDSSNLFFRLDSYKKLTKTYGRGFLSFLASKNNFGVNFPTVIANEILKKILLTDG